MGWDGKNIKSWPWTPWLYLSLLSHKTHCNSIDRAVDYFTLHDWPRALALFYNQHDLIYKLVYNKCHHDEPNNSRCSKWKKNLLALLRSAFLYTLVSDFIKSNPITSIAIHIWLNQGSKHPIIPSPIFNIWTLLCCALQCRVAQHKFFIFSKFG